MAYLVELHGRRCEFKSCPNYVYGLQDVCRFHRRGSIDMKVYMHLHTKYGRVNKDMFTATKQLYKAMEVIRERRKDS